MSARGEVISQAALRGAGCGERVAPSRGMIIINADDWGGWKTATDAARACFEAGRITSATAMVFMNDSKRGAELANGLGLAAGLHLNFNQAFTGGNTPQKIARAQERISRFLRRGKYAQLIYHPWLRDDFRLVFQAQVDEFRRLYGREPSHIDGHRHMHLCANMLMDGIIPAGASVRRSFSFWPGEKNFLNRAYRGWVDARLERFYGVTDYFFSLEQSIGPRLQRVFELAATARVELMTHPEKPEEFAFLMSDAFCAMLERVTTGDYRDIQFSRNRETVSAGRA